jgi:hypothetical protein
MEAYLYGSDHLLKITNARSAATGDPINDATVQATLYRRGTTTEVTGQAWPVYLFHVIGSDGDYHGQIDYSLDVGVDDLLDLKLVFNGGEGFHRQWLKAVRVVEGSLP